MISAKEAISPIKTVLNSQGIPEVEGSTHLLEVLPRLLDTQSRELRVVENGECVGVIDQGSMLDAFGRMIASRDDSSIVTIVCDPQNYSASRIANAVEDVDAHLVDLITTPGSDGNLYVTLRIRSTDASAACASLERYGYHLTRDFSAVGRYDELVFERLLELRTLIEV